MVEFSTPIRPTKNATPNVSRLIFRASFESNRAAAYSRNTMAGQSQRFDGDVFVAEEQRAIVSSSRACEGAVERLQVRIRFVCPRVGGMSISGSVGFAYCVAQPVHQRPSGHSEQPRPEGVYHVWN
jgi:hypothetical protein